MVLRDGGEYIKFNQDGTGELWCFCNFNYWIAADIEWRGIGVHTSSQSESAITTNEAPQLLGQLELEMTLMKRVPKWANPSVLTTEKAPINEKILAEDAFRPKKYVVRIEQGNFMKPILAAGAEGSNTERFAFRLLFDPSPYPPRSEWKQPEGGPDEGQFWDHREFVSGASEELEKRPGRAMNDTSVQEEPRCAVM